MRANMLTVAYAEAIAARLWLLVQLQQPEIPPAACLPCWPLSPAQRRRAVLRALGRWSCCP